MLVSPLHFAIKPAFIILIIPIHLFPDYLFVYIFESIAPEGILTDFTSLVFLGCIMYSEVTVK